MSHKPEWQCRKTDCKRMREGWHDEDELSSAQCEYHNDQDIEYAQERAEWNYYHE